MTVRRDGTSITLGHDITLRKETIEALAVSLEKSRAILRRRRRFDHRDRQEPEGR